MCSDEEHSQPLMAIWRRRAQGLVVFTSHALQFAVASKATSADLDHGLMTGLTSLLIRLTSLQDGALPDMQLTVVAAAAQSCLRRALMVMSALDFIRSVLTLSICPENKVLQIATVDYSTATDGFV